jgi:hypothetical protein
MIYQIRADRDVTSKAPEGTGTRRRTVRVPIGPPMTFVFGAQPTYLECDELPIEIITDDHLLTKAVEPQNLDIEIVVINLKSERVQTDLTGSRAELKSERVQGDDDVEPELKSERVQKPNHKRR